MLMEYRREFGRVAGVTGLNHITLAVSEIDRSVCFYRDLLGGQLRAIWAEGAYLEIGSLWLCLSLDGNMRSEPHAEYSHIAFSVSEADYDSLSDRIACQCILWNEDRSEGASTYFLDPDGHKLEIHVGTLASRLAHYLANPAKGSGWWWTDEREWKVPA
jgi:catechol 2,3-dioxygenase-like lactoylglutathione lyase family enzyme